MDDTLHQLALDYRCAGTPEHAERAYQALEAYVLQLMTAARRELYAVAALPEVVRQVFAQGTKLTDEGVPQAIARNVLVVADAMTQAMEVQTLPDGEALQSQQQPKAS